jgi:ketosteroid isomerase-like protein
MRRKPLDTHEAADAWVDAWSSGWANHDPDVIAERYAEECEFVSQPFRDPLRGAAGARAYAAQVFADERSARFRFADPIVAADGRVAVEYWAIVTGMNGEVVTLAGVTILRFDREGRAVEHRDHWATNEGARNPSSQPFGGDAPL